MADSAGGAPDRGGAAQAGRAGWPDWEALVPALAEGPLAGMAEDPRLLAREVVAACSAAPPVPVQAAGAEGPESPAARAWFELALEEIAHACLGFDPAQAKGPDATFVRRSLGLLSATAWYLELRFPVGRAMRQAYFIVDLEAHDGVTVMPLQGQSAEFHTRVNAYLGLPGQRACDPEQVADYCRAFCSRLVGEIDGQKLFFVPVESAAEVQRVAIGPLPAALMGGIGPMRRYSPDAGAQAGPATVHLFDAHMLVGRMLFRVLLALTAQGLGTGGGRMTVSMLEDEMLSGETPLPVVPLAPDPLTYAYFPLRAA